MSTVSTATHTLLIEDNDSDALLVAERLNSYAPGEFTLDRVSSLGAGLERLACGTYSATIVDLHLPDSAGAKAWRELRSNASGTPVVVLTGAADDLLEALAVQEGVQDFLLKADVTGPGLVRALKHAMTREARLANLRRQHLELMAADARIRNLMVTSAEGLAVVDRSGTVVFMNEQCARWARGAIERAIGSRFPFDLPSKGVRHLDVAVDEPGGSAGVSHVRVAKMELRTVPSSWAGKPVTVVTLRDVTEQDAETQRLAFLTKLDRAVATQASDTLAVCETVADLLPRLIPYQELEIAVSRVAGAPADVIVQRGEVKPFADWRGTELGSAKTSVSSPLGDRAFPRGWIKVGSRREDVMNDGAVEILRHVAAIVTASLGLLGSTTEPAA